MRAQPSLLPFRRHRARIVWGLALAFVALFSATAEGAPFGPLLPSPLEWPIWPLGDPLPIQRWYLPIDRKFQEWKPANAGTRIQLSRKEFEARVRRAALARSAVGQPARLLEARYEAVLDGTSLRGTGQWRIHNPITGLNRLPLGSWNLAVRQAHLDDQDAILGNLDGRGQALAVAGYGPHLAKLDWSARGDTSPAGLRFELKLPSCTLSSIQLELPADRTVAQATDACLLSGPLPGATPTTRRWHLDCAGWSQIDLLIRGPQDVALTNPLIIVREQTEFKLAPGIQEAEYDLNLEVAHGYLQELVAECSPELRPIEVSVRSTQIEHWRLEPGAKAGEPNRVIIPLPEPFQGSTLPIRIRCRAPLRVNQRWQAPGLRLLHGVIRGESISIHLAPEFRLEHWQPGAFELLRLYQEADGTQVLSLQTTLPHPPAAAEPGDANQPPPPPAADARPSGLVRIQSMAAKAREQLWWHVGSHGQTLLGQLSIEVQRGQAFQVSVAVPAHWRVDRVEGNSPDAIASWTETAATDAGSQILLEPAHPIEPGHPLTILLECRPRNEQLEGTVRPGATPTEVNLPLPRLVPSGVEQWEGSLAISVDNRWLSRLQSSLPTGVSDDKLLRAASEALAEPLRSTMQRLLTLRNRTVAGTAAPDYFIPFHAQTLRGSLLVQPRPVVSRAHCLTDLVFRDAQLTGRLTIQLEPVAGQPLGVDLQMSQPVRGWNWRSNGSIAPVATLHSQTFATGVLALAGIGDQDPLSPAIAVAAISATGQVWRLAFPQPVSGPVTLEADLDLGAQFSLFDPMMRLSFLSPISHDALGPVIAAAEQMSRQTTHSRTWCVPLARMVGTEPSGGIVQIHAAPGQSIEIQSAQGLQELPRPDTGSPDSNTRAFQYGTARAQLFVTLGTSRSRQPAEIRVDHVKFISHLQSDGGLVHQFRFRLSGWSERWFPIRLPAGARLVHAWADGFPIARPEFTTDDSGRSIVSLPVTAKSGGHALAVEYATTGVLGRIWSHLETSPPELPVPDPGHERIWSLPPGIVPLDSKGWRQLPEIPANDLQVGRPALRLLEQTLERLPTVLSGTDPESQQQRVIRSAELRLQNSQALRLTGTLGALIRLLMQESTAESVPLVIDAEGLARARLSAATPLRTAPDQETAVARDENEHSPLPFEQLGLRLIRGPVGLLLTALSPDDGLFTRTANPELVSAPLQQALEEARSHGHDATGRYWNAIDWLRLSEDPSNPGSLEWDDDLAAIPTSSIGVSGSRWQKESSETGSDSLDLVREAPLRLGSFLLAIGLVLTVWGWPFATTGGRLLFLSSSLAILALTHLWLPSSLTDLTGAPLVGLGVAALGWYVASFLKPARREGRASALTFSLALLAVLPSEAADSDKYRVYLVGTSPRGAETVLAAPELLDELDALSRPGRGLGDRPVLSAANYSIQVGDRLADVEATYTVHLPAVPTSILNLPLDGVELREARLDGQATFPRLLANPRKGYAIDLTGRGRHVLVLRFSVSLLTNGEEQEIRFSIPEVAASHLQLSYPGRPRYLAANLARGAQQVTTGPTGTTLDADLGITPTLQVRCRLDRPESAAARLQARELYFWDLQPSSSRLLGVLQYTVERGAVTQLPILLPNGLAVRRVEVSNYLDVEGTPRLAHWHLAPKDRQQLLQLELQAPITGSVQVFLELVPTQPLSTLVDLSVPQPLDATPLDSLLGYRSVGLVATVTNSLRLSGVVPESFTAAWQGAGTIDPGPADRAFAFRRSAGAPPALRLQLAVPEPAITGTQEIQSQIRPGQANVTVALRLQQADDKLACLEWEVPGEVQMTDLTGPDVLSWSRDRARVQVWLRRSLKETQLQWNGWFAIPAELNQPFEFPHIRFGPAVALQTRLELRPAPGTALIGDDLQNLSPTGDRKRGDDTLRYLVRREFASGRFHLTAARAEATAAQLTVVRSLAGQVQIETHIATRVRRGELAECTVTILHPACQHFRVEGSLVQVQEDARPGPGQRLLKLAFRPPLTGRQSFSLVGRLPLAPEEKLSIPIVIIQGLENAGRWLVVSSRDLQLILSPNAVPEKQLDRLQGNWPAPIAALRRSGGTLWEVKSLEPPVAVQFRPPTAGRLHPEVVFAEQRVEVDHALQLRREAEYWLWGAGSLTLTLPAHSRLQATWLDGEELKSLAGQMDLRVLLTAPTVHSLRLRWEQPTAAISGTLTLQAPVLASAGGEIAIGHDQTVWQVQAPPWAHLAPEAGKALSEDPAGLDLSSASAFLQLSRHLAEEKSAEKHDAEGDILRWFQDQFYRSCSSAQYRLALRSGAEEQRERQNMLRATLRQLQSANIEQARALDYESVRSRAEESVRASHPPLPCPLGVPKLSSAADGASLKMGLVTLWRSGPDGDFPVLHLRDARQAASQHRAMLSGTILLLLIGMVVFSYLPRVNRWLLLCSPELLAAAGLAALASTGFAVLGAATLVLGLVLRFLWLVARLVGHGPEATVAARNGSSVAR